MTDPLTDAVRRLKGLQEDVERLKAAQNEEGEPRIFLQEQDAARASDALSLRAADIGIFESARASDALSLRAADIGIFESARGSDVQRPLVSETVRPLYWAGSETGWNAAAYPDADQ
jgi:hypothetical protein